MRDYHNQMHGEMAVTFGFGVAISLVVPVMFWVQNCVQSVVEQLFGINNKTLKNIFKQSFSQSVVQFEMSVCNEFEKSARSTTVIPKDKSFDQIDDRPKTKRGSWKYFIGLIASHLTYISLPIILVCMMQFLSGNGTVCRPLKSKAKFLLDNGATVTGNISLGTIYQERKAFGKSHEKWMDWTNNGLLWDDYASERKHNYMPLQNIDHFIEQFNFVGFHDICNYFEERQIELILPDVYRTKGLHRIFPGYARDNTTGSD